MLSIQPSEAVISVDYYSQHGISHMKFAGEAEI